MSLFSDVERQNAQRVQPLAARMRPSSLDEFVGQRHFLGEGKLLRRLLNARRIASLLFYGPPGTGKTTLARLLAQETEARFHQLSAVESTVKDLRQVLRVARDEVCATGRQTMLFVDEIHRFSKSQQDVLLHDVEDGTIALVGATTSNPYFAVNSALVSRSQIFQFEPIAAEDIVALVNRALGDKQQGLGDFEVQVQEGALEYLAELCDGDARRVLNTLEIAVLSATEQPVTLDRQAIADSVQRKAMAFDKEDTHYDLASAIIKSIRGSDPDAAIYWLARMLESGEDIRFIARRLVILASEDIGNADPQALMLAVATMQACEFVGLPECQLTLSQAVAYLACAPKSNAATAAIDTARRDIASGRTLVVPRHLRDSHYAGASKLDHGTGYVYAHEDPDGVVAQEYLGVEKQYYLPVDRGFEAQLRERLVRIRKKLGRDAEASDDDPLPPSES